MTESVIAGGAELLRPEDGSLVEWFGSLMCVKVADASHSLVEVVEPPGAASPVHVHAEDETFCVLEGEYTVRCGDLETVAGPGAVVRLPRGIPHSHRVTGAGNARAFMIFAPGGVEGFFLEAGTPTERRELPTPTAPDPARLAEVGGRYGLRIVGPPPASDARPSPAARTEPTLGPVNHVAITVTDVGRSERWYAAALGLVRIDGEVAEDGSGHVTLLHPDGGWVLALSSGSEPAIAHAAFTCADRDALIRWRETLPRRGVTPGSLTDAPYGSGFVLRDPDGLEVELFAPAAMPA